MLLLALSCLQGRPMQDAAEELSGLGDVDLQLTAGCVPTVGFADWVAQSGLRAPTHHGFDFAAPRTEVWDDDTLCARWDSVHPPRRDQGELHRVLDAALEAGVALETMYPGYLLGSGDDIAEAMRRQVPLAVDVSHVFIQLSAGSMSMSMWEQLQRYDRVVEVHLSSNDGKRDQHRPLSASTFGLRFAQEALRVGVPVVIESYLHRATRVERQAMLDLVRK